MIKRILRRCTRQPLTYIAVILFTAILTVILCFLHCNQKQEQQNYESTFQSTSIEFDITWLDGTRLNDSEPASGHMADILPELFLGTCRHEPHFDDLITDLQIRMSIWCEEPADETAGETIGTTWNMVGITSPEAAKDQPSQFAESIQWYEGFDESILRTDRFVCIVPSDYEGNAEEVALIFSARRGYIQTFQIVGRCTEKGNDNMYCPYGAMEHIYARLGQPKVVERLSGLLANNDDLELFRERAKEWFATPNATGAPTPWGKWVYDYYPLAMDIDDSLLNSLEEDLKQSMQVNRIASVLVFILSTGAGFLTGFLVIRSRKREIALMRTLGTSNGGVCIELILEQFFCVVAGIVIGGSYALWEPMGKLSIFAGVYMAGLAVALLIFANANLLATIKEDE